MRVPDEVRGDEVGRELDPPERRVERLREGLDREGLREARDALEEQVAAGEQRHEHALEHRVLADDDAPDLVQHGLGGRARVERLGRGLGVQRLRLRLIGLRCGHAGPPSPGWRAGSALASVAARSARHLFARPCGDTMRVR